MIGTKLTDYEITAHLGSGGIERYFRPTDTKLGRSVAIKFLPIAFMMAPVFDLNSNLFRRVTAARDPRIMQFALKHFSNCAVSKRRKNLQ